MTFWMPAPGILKGSVAGKVVQRVMTYSTVYKRSTLTLHDENRRCASPSSHNNQHSMIFLSEKITTGEKVYYEFQTYNNNSINYLYILGSDTPDNEGEGHNAHVNKTIGNHWNSGIQRELRRAAIGITGIGRFALDRSPSGSWPTATTRVRAAFDNANGMGWVSNNDGTWLDGGDPATQLNPHWTWDPAALFDGLWLGNSPYSQIGLYLMPNTNVQPGFNLSLNFPVPSGFSTLDGDYTEP